VEAEHAFSKMWVNSTQYVDITNRNVVYSGPTFRLLTKP
jgi:hypothetical protein